MSDQASSTADPATLAPDAPPAPAPETTAAPKPKSLQEQLRDSRRRAVNRHTEDFEISGYDPPLWGTFRALDDYREVRQFIQAHANVSDEADRELAIAADTLAAACTAMYVKVDGVRADLDLPPQGFTPASAAYLVVETTTTGDPRIDDAGNEVPVRVDNNRQAVLSIIPNTVVLMALYAEIDMFFKKAGVKVDRDDLPGNSPAPS